jgi:LEA14-like dessication related protein
MTAAAGQTPAGRLGHLLLILVITLTCGCASVGLEQFDDPDVELLALQPLPSQGMEARFLLRLRIVNPNPIALEIDGMAYDVYLRDTKVLSGASNREVTVAAYSEGTAELEVAAGMLGSLTLLRDLMSSPPDGGIPYRLNTKISRKGLGGSMRISREGMIDLSTRRRAAAPLPRRA